MVDRGISPSHNNEPCYGKPSVSFLLPWHIALWLAAVVTLWLTVAGGASMARAATEQPLVVAHASKVQLAVGEVIDFTITATFADGDGGFYEIDLDEQNLPDGLAVLDTGDSSTTIAAKDTGLAQGKPTMSLDSVVEKRRFYQMRAIEAGIWVLPSAQLRAKGGDASQQGQKTSPIYMVIKPPSAAAHSAKASHQAQPFFRLLPPEAAIDKDGKPLAYYQISGLVPTGQVAFWRLAAVLGGAVIVLFAIWLVFGYGRDPALKNKGQNDRDGEPPTLDQLKEALSDAAGRDRYPQDIKSSFDTVYKVLISYGRSFLHEDFRAVLPRHVQKSTQFISSQQREQFVAALLSCQQGRFSTDAYGESGSEGHVVSSADRQLLHRTAALAQAVLIAPPIAETSDL